MSGTRFRSNLKKAGKKTGHCLQSAAWQTCKCVLWTMCAPCICCAILFLPRRRCGRRQQCRAMDPPKPPLPAPRRRALTIPSSDWHEAQQTQDQPQSAFMTKLPLEIRRMIYEKALGGASIHLGLINGEMLARRCGAVDECRCGRHNIIQEKRLEFVLPLLRSCRQIYSEAVEYLYTANAFSLSTDMEEIATIDYLSYFMLPQRISQIRDLYLYWELDSYHYGLMSPSNDPDLEPWLASWTALSRLTGLRRLHISLVFRNSHWYDYYDGLWKQRGAELLGRIPDITAPRSFVITLPDRRCSTAIDVGSSKCILQLPAKKEDETSTDDDST